MYNNVNLKELYNQVKPGDKVISVFKKKAKNGVKTFLAVENMFVCFWQELFWGEQAMGLTFSLYFSILA